ncbi:MAG: surface protein [Pirellulaceae bacterium]|nr:MAG: surface protein [Pirellulaceae bacterium]
MLPVVRSRFLCGFGGIMLLAGGLAVPVAAAGESSWEVVPDRVELHGHFDQVQLVVWQRSAETGADENLTAACAFQSSDPGVVEVSSSGRLRARSNGQATIVVQHGEQKKEVPVVVEGVEGQPKPGYYEFISPLLNRAGCNLGACHATQHGKGGFKLSVFSYAPEEDYAAMVRDRSQRRVNFWEPDESLILLKPTTQIPHGGGKRFSRESLEYEVLRAWIAAGAPAPQGQPPRVVRLELYPAETTTRVDTLHQLRAVAVYDDGRQRDVTAWCRYDSMDESRLRVDPQGRVQVVGQGQAVVMARFEGQAAVAQFIVPYRQDVDLADWENHNFVDELAAKKFRQLGIVPSPLCDDATFLRRAFLDAIGTLPTVEETRKFLEDSDPDKRRKLIDRLLGMTGDPALDTYNDTYAAYWTLRWSDLIRNNSNDVGDQGMWALYNWLRDQFRRNVPYDQWVRELITAKGSVYSSGPANYFLINRDPPSLTEATSQIFLGVRLECAKCHHHPFEKYGQEDYYGFAAFFARVALKNTEDFGLFGRERDVMVRLTGEVTHPKTGKAMPPTPLEGKPTDHPLDRRLPLADWLTSPDNYYFSRAVVNRYVGYLLGRGLVEPVDDLRSSNPASNPELLDALAADFVSHGFDLKHLMRTIMTSRLYQLSSDPTADNAADERFYSHYYVKRLAAEPLLDAVDQVTGSPTKFPNLPLGTRAIELPDAEYPNYFLTTFAKPRRASVCECERSPDPNLAQALHTLNGDTLARKIADDKGRLAQLLQAGMPPEEIIQTFYLAALCRYPRAEELEACREYLAAAGSAREGLEDIVWALLNSKEFLCVH